MLTEQRKHEISYSENEGVEFYNTDLTPLNRVRKAEFNGKEYAFADQDAHRADGVHITPPRTAKDADMAQMIRKGQARPYPGAINYV